MPNSNIISAAERLRNAASSHITCEPVRDLIGATDLEAAYEVQQLNTMHRIQQGAKVIGSKIGLTAPAVQNQFGIDQPDFGMLWHDTEIDNGGEISMSQLMQPKAEVEIAFVLGKDLDSEHLTSVDILSGIDYALPAIEIVGSRIRDWDIKITDTIADNASASHWVLGHSPKKLSQLDLLNCKMQMKNHDEVVSQGVGKNCLGSPINAMLWLARKMVEIKQPMKAGDLILTGALGPMTNAKAGDHFTATIEGLGQVSLAFK